ncbi:hypothetical protein Q7P37_010422 [Cladosporium fusiforme]
MSFEHIPLPSEGASGGKDNTTATATCFCGTVQLRFPTTRPGLVDSFVCSCHDCRKITASMFASNFIVKDSETTHVRGRDKLTKFAQNKTIESGNTMENHFCSVCGTLMYRISSGWPGLLVTRIGTVDDYNLHETVLKPRLEQYTKDRVCWFNGAEGAVQFEGAAPLGKAG